MRISDWSSDVCSSDLAGRFLISRGVKPVDFNSYGSRRGNDDVMVRGTFANIRIKNLMLGGEEVGRPGIGLKYLIVDPGADPSFQHVLGAHVLDAEAGDQPGLQRVDVVEIGRAHV